MKQKRRKVKLCLRIIIAMITLLMVSQTYAQIGSNWLVTGDFGNGDCIYQGPAKVIEDYNDNILLQNISPLVPAPTAGSKFAVSMDLILAPGSQSYCPPVLLNVNNTLYASDSQVPQTFPCYVDADRDFGLLNGDRRCFLIQPLNPNPYCSNGTEFIEINGTFTSDFRSAGGTWITTLFGSLNPPPTTIDGPQGEWEAIRTGDAVLFPWIVKSDDVTTVVSVVNTAQTQAEALGLPFHNNRIHIEYWHKKTTANDQEEACIEANFEVSSSKDDKVTWDIAGHFNGGLPMFNDESNEVIFAPDMTLAVENPRRGFLIVENNTESLLDARTPVDGTIYGEATIIEHKTGAAWGYIAYNSIWGTPYFYDSSDQNGEVIGRTQVDFEAPCDDPEDSGEVTQTTLLNPNDAITKLFVTPVALGSQKQGNINASVQLCRFPEMNAPDDEADFGSHYTGDCTGGGIWNNEEGGFSFTEKKNIVCTTADNIVDFFGGAGTSAYTQWVASGKDGWSYITPDRGYIDARDGTEAYVEADDVIIGKLEFGTGLNWDGSIADTINTFVWLRDSSTYQTTCAELYPVFGPSFRTFDPFPFTADLRCRPGGTNNIHNEPYFDFELRDYIPPG
jgi:hypothetical protein